MTNNTVKPYIKNEELIKLYSQHKSLRTVGKMVGMTGAGVKYRFNKAGINVGEMYGKKEGIEDIRTLTFLTEENIKNIKDYAKVNRLFLSEAINVLITTGYRKSFP